MNTIELAYSYTFRQYNEDNQISFSKTDNIQRLIYSINGFTDNNLITEVIDYLNKIHTT